MPLAASISAWGTGFAGADAEGLGQWEEDAVGLPAYHYTGPVPFPLPAGITREYLGEDPFFLLGNYRMTAFAHASGHYQILSGERAWGRLNQGDKMFSGANDATVEIGGKQTPLVGVTENAAQRADKLFGIGFAQYRYELEGGLEVTRTLSLLPSTGPGEGTSAFVLSVQLHNGGSKALDVTYRERATARYAQLFAAWDPDRDLVQYSETVTQDPAQVWCDFKATEPKPLLFSQGGRMARFEGTPPSLYMRLIPAVRDVKAEHIAEQDAQGGHWIGVRARYSLAAGQEKTLHCIVGYAFDHAEIDSAVNKLTAALSDGAGPHFRAHWNKAIPAFTDEKDAELGREMRWNAGALEQMATWREYYDETVVPQGTVYDYVWGDMTCSRDLAQHALPMCHLNPAIARSVLRYLMKRTMADGEIKTDDYGFGWAPDGGRLTSDQQLYLFLLLNEYLRKTKDASILTDSVEYYPREAGAKGSGLDHVRDAFLYLRDRIGVGKHGLVKLWNSDWNDMFFFWPTNQPYNYIFDQSESLMNTTMAVVILDELANNLRTYAKTQEGYVLADAAAQYRAQLLQALMKDWGSADFPKRMYFQGQPVGLGDMWLEPQGFALQIKEVPVERKRTLYAAMQARLMRGEAMGPKQIEKPIQHLETPAGTREDGGFWYALVGPVVLGLAGFDREAAESMLRSITFANFSKHFPQYWTGQWSASDALDSAAVPTQGLSLFLPTCAHANAWPLYCWLRLREG